MVLLSVLRGCSVAGSFPGMTYSTVLGVLSPEHKRRKRKTSGRFAVGTEDVQ